jgi:hypothetical protein
MPLDPANSVSHPGPASSDWKPSRTPTRAFSTWEIRRLKEFD